MRWSTRFDHGEYTAAVKRGRASYQHLKAKQGPSVLFTSSSYTRGRENYALYSSTKAALVNLTQALSEEWSEVGIHVNVINPERIQTLRCASRPSVRRPPDTLLPAELVAQSAMEMITSNATGLVIDVTPRTPQPCGAPPPPRCSGKTPKQRTRQRVSGLGFQRSSHGRVEGGQVGTQGRIAKVVGPHRSRSPTNSSAPSNRVTAAAGH